MATAMSKRASLPLLAPEGHSRGAEARNDKLCMCAVCDCTKIPTTNEPVCASDGATYGNECIAQCANVLIVSEGECPYCVIKSNGGPPPSHADLWAWAGAGRQLAAGFDRFAST